MSVPTSKQCKVDERNKDIEWKEEFKPETWEIVKNKCRLTKRKREYRETIRKQLVDHAEKFWFCNVVGVPAPSPTRFLARRMIISARKSHININVFRKYHSNGIWRRNNSRGGRFPESHSVSHPARRLSTFVRIFGDLTEFCLVRCNSIFFIERDVHINEGDSSWLRLCPKRCALNRGQSNRQRCECGWSHHDGRNTHLAGFQVDGKIDKWNHTFRKTNMSWIYRLAFSHISPMFSRLDRHLTG